MTNYKQLSQDQRYLIGRLLKAGSTEEGIATAIGGHKPTIGSELKNVKAIEYDIPKQF